MKNQELNITRVLHFIAIKEYAKFHTFSMKIKVPKSRYKLYALIVVAFKFPLYLDS